MQIWNSLVPSDKLLRVLYDPVLIYINKDFGLRDRIAIQSESRDEIKKKKRKIIREEEGWQEKELEQEYEQQNEYLAFMTAKKQRLGNEKKEKKKRGNEY